MGLISSLVGAEGIEPPKPKYLIYSQAQLTALPSSLSKIIDCNLYKVKLIKNQLRSSVCDILPIPKVY